MDASQIIAFIAASALLTILPGPDILFVITQSISSGWRNGIAVATGLCSGLIVHTSAVAFGVAAIIAQSAFALLAIKILGAAYLLYLAYNSLKEKGLSISESNSKYTKWKLVRIGFVMNVLNPKVLLFFLAFLPQFIRSTGNTTIQIIVLGIIFIIQAFTIFSLVSLCSGMLNRYITTSSIGKHIGTIKCVVYLLIAVNLFWI